MMPNKQVEVGVRHSRIILQLKEVEVGVVNQKTMEVLPQVGEKLVLQLHLMIGVVQEEIQVLNKYFILKTLDSGDR
jgi:hypothetical protein